MADEIAIAVSGIVGALIGSMLAWFGQHRIATAHRAWEMKLRAYSKYLEAVSELSQARHDEEIRRGRSNLKLRAYSKYLEAVSELSQARHDEEIRRGRSNLTAAKGQIIVTGSVEVIEALQRLEPVASRDKSWAATPIGKSVFSELITAMRKDLGGEAEVAGAAESLLLGSSKP